MIKRFLLILFLIISFPLTASSESSFDDEFNDDFEFQSQATKLHDPLEKYNRKIHNFNEYVDRYFFEHIARLYREGMPRRVRTSIRNFLTNLSLPMSMANSLAQGKVDNSLGSLSSFLINSTVGIFGIFDVAGEKHIRYNEEDFGQTLGHYGIGSGPYLVMPFLGPSSARDFTGFAIDRSINPVGGNLIEIGGSQDFIKEGHRISINLLGAVDSREGLLDIIDDVRKDSFDSYATIRSAYLQRRSNQLQQ